MIIREIEMEACEIKNPADIYPQGIKSNQEKIPK